MADSNAPEHQDRGLLGMFGKKKEDETHQQHGTAVDTHGHGHVEGGKSHGEGEEKKHGKLHRSNSSSSSSSDEEEDEKGEKKKKKKGGLKDKIKLPGHKKEEEHGYGKTEEHAHGKTEEHGEKKGLMDKIKEKLPGHNKEQEKGH